MKLGIIFLFFVLMVATMELAAARDKQGNLAVYGIGSKTCEKFLQDRKDAADLSYHHWVGGYISGFNTGSEETYDIVGTKDFDSLMVWLENYCKANPLDAFGVATGKLMIELFPQRKKIPGR
ncbi:MAG TPA: hypothetical protein VEI96_06295 [Thermodesulfovibrionales bacterium]|nr:hypothetical protein [Thermodesulfovibrionales bacterium]